MSTFIAIPVSQGDSFYLDRGGWSVLVDGGGAQSSFGAVFQSTTGTSAVDVLACTHNDADHANGVLGFLESGLGCKEVWLPGRWLAALPDLLRPFVDVGVELAKQVSDENLVPGIEAPRVDMTSLERLAERVRQQRVETNREDEREVLATEDGWPERLRENLETLAPGEGELPWPWFSHQDLWFRPFFPFWGIFRFPSARIPLFESAIEAAHRIRAIASVAFHRGIPVRWFEYDTARPSGGDVRLQPLNAREIARVRAVGTPLLYRLALTVANKESLVFWSPPTDGSPGVLFNADSDLANVQRPSGLASAIATAPHHGSEANADTYAVVQAAAAQHASSLTWVRSDRRNRSRPGPSYLRVAGQHLCTICRLAGGGASPKHRPVHLLMSHGNWTPHRATLTCVCQE